LLQQSDLVKLSKLESVRGDITIGIINKINIKISFFIGISTSLFFNIVRKVFKDFDLII
jgi:hypothetical protein